MRSSSHWGRAGWFCRSSVGGSADPDSGCRPAGRRPQGLSESRDDHGPASEACPSADILGFGRAVRRESDVGEGDVRATAGADRPGPRRAGTSVSQVFSAEQQRKVGMSDALDSEPADESLVCHGQLYPLPPREDDYSAV